MVYSKSSKDEGVIIDKQGTLYNSTSKKTDKYHSRLEKEIRINDTLWTSKFIKVYKFILYKCIKFVIAGFI